MEGQSRLDLTATGLRSVCSHLPAGGELRVEPFFLSGFIFTLVSQPFCSSEPQCNVNVGLVYSLLTVWGNVLYFMNVGDGIKETLEGMSSVRGRAHTHPRCLPLLASLQLIRAVESRKFALLSVRTQAPFELY